MEERTGGKIMLRSLQQTMHNLKIVATLISNHKSSKNPDEWKRDNDAGREWTQLAQIEHALLNPEYYKIIITSAKETNMLDQRADEAGKKGIEIATREPGKGHFFVSIAKSIVRIIACVFLISTGVQLVVYAGIALLVAEALGMIEEMV